MGSSILLSIIKRLAAAERRLAALGDAEATIAALQVREDGGLGVCVRMVENWSLLCVVCMCVCLLDVNV